MFALEILGEIMKLQTNCFYLSVTKQLLSHTSFAHCRTASKTEHHFDFPFFTWILCLMCCIFSEKEKLVMGKRHQFKSKKKLCPTFYGNCFVNGGLSRRHSKLNLLTNEYMSLKLEKESFNCPKEGANNCLVTLIQRSISLSATSR